MWPAEGIVEAPVCAAARPAASTIATCRLAAPSSSASSRANASGADTPAAISSTPLGPYEISHIACVATAPTPGRAHGTTGPTEK